MSAPLKKEDVLFQQRLLKATGFYTGDIDGIWGPKSDKAEADFIAQTDNIANTYGVFDTRSEKYIRTLIPKAQVAARKFMKNAQDNQLNVKIISGTRSYAEQDALYAQVLKVTNAKGGQSNHNFGLAWDIGFFEPNGGYIENDDVYKQNVGKLLTGITDVEWGGNWHSFKDYPHYQLKAVSEQVVHIREKFEAGEEYA